jgi:hypothetical protein
MTCLDAVDGFKNHNGVECKGVMDIDDGLVLAVHDGEQRLSHLPPAMWLFNTPP